MSLSKLRELRQVCHENWPTEKCDPAILLQFQIPNPMAGLNPRTVLGDEWWKEERQKATAATDGHCAACGVHKMNAMGHQWLECHEQYDYVGKQLIYRGCVPLCHYCHAYIHRGRLRRMKEAGKVRWEEYNAIINHGQRLTSSSKLKPPVWKRRPLEILGTSWTGWSLRVGDKVFRSNITSASKWRRRYVELA